MLVFDSRVSSFESVIPNLFRDLSSGVAPFRCIYVASAFFLKAEISGYLEKIYEETLKNYGWTMTTYGTAVGDYTCRAYYAYFRIGLVGNDPRQDDGYAFCF